MIILGTVMTDNFSRSHYLLYIYLDSMLRASPFVIGDVYDSESSELVGIRRAIDGLSFKTTSKTIRIGVQA
jgi:hypothetical protein